MRIRIISSCLASGKSLSAGEVYEAPRDLTESDVKTLLTLRRAVEVKDNLEKPDKGGKKR